MRKRISAIFYPKISTNTKVQHDNCPPVEESWCSWQHTKVTISLECDTHKPLRDTVYDAIKLFSYSHLNSDDSFTKKKEDQNVNLEGQLYGAEIAD